MNRLRRNAAIDFRYSSKGIVMYRFWFAVLLATSWLGSNHDANAVDVELADVLLRFREYSDAELVFDRSDLPAGRYHDVLKPLDEKRRVQAAIICVREAKLYPPRFFHEVGLQKVGVFAACASNTTTDPKRTFDKQLGGYRYFGVYNGQNAVAAAYYSDGQLALTFHHEIFHHVDSTVDGVTASWQLSSDDAFYLAAISGHKRLVAPPIESDDLRMLRQKCIGFTLKDAVSDYAAKNPREDQAETARHVMSMLPNSLVQVIDKPNLAGSQRILHVLLEYERSVPDGPSFDWFVDVALGRAQHEITHPTADDLLLDLRDITRSTEPVTRPMDVRATLKSVVRLLPGGLNALQRQELVDLSAVATESLLHSRIRPSKTADRFDIWGEEDSTGANWTLRHDVVQFSRDARRLAAIASTIQGQDSSKVPVRVAATLQTNLRWLARYYQFIKTHFSISDGTDDVFRRAKARFIDSLRPFDADAAGRLSVADWQEIASQTIQAR